MRFFLDENVDAAVGAVLRDAGHDCWTFGRHLWLRCEPFEAPDAIATHLPEITSLLANMAHLVVEVTVDRVTRHPPRWR